MCYNRRREVIALDEKRSDYIDAVEIYETDDYEEVNRLLATKEWALLNVAGGQAEDLTPRILYCLGRPYRAEDLPWI